MITDNPVCIIQRGKAKSDRLAHLVIEGCKRKGRIHYGDETPFELRSGETPVVIGTHPSTFRLLHSFHDTKTPFVVVDNGYLKGYKEGGYFRATTNALQWVGGLVGRKPVDEVIGSERFRSLDLAPMKPWREVSHGHVLVILQSEVWYEMMGTTRAAWLSQIMDRIRHRTDLDIVVRDKPTKAMPQPTLESQFENCAAVVGFSSAALIKAIMAGIPVFADRLCAASPLAMPHLGSIGTAANQLRLPTLYNLAANQWNEREIDSGRMWADLTSRYEHEFYELA